MRGSSRCSYFHPWLLSHKLVGMRPSFYPRGLGGVLTAEVVKKGSVCRGVRRWDFNLMWLYGKSRKLLAETPRWLAHAPDAGDAGVCR